MENALSIGHEIRNSDLASEKQANRDRLRKARARQKAIGRELRRMYDNVALSPLPEDFVDLLKKIDEVAEPDVEVDEAKKMS